MYKKKLLSLWQFILAIPEMQNTNQTLRICKRINYLLIQHTS